MPPRRRKPWKRPQRPFRKAIPQITRVQKAVTYRSRASSMKTRETYKFFIDPKNTTVGDEQSAVMLDFVLNSPYSLSTGFIDKGAQAVVNAEPAVVEFDGTNGDVATVAPGIYENSSRPGGDRTGGAYTGCKFSQAYVTGAKFTSSFTPVQAANIKCQPGYCGTIRSSSNDDGGLTQANATFTNISRLPFVTWRRVRGPIVNTLDTLPGSIGASDVLSRSISLTTKHSVSKWNNVSDMNDVKDRFSWSLNSKTDQPTERDHITWFLIPELQKSTLGGTALQPPAGILTVTIDKYIMFTEPLSGKGDLATANLPQVMHGPTAQSMWEYARSAYGFTQRYGPAALAGSAYYYRSRAIGARRRHRQYMLRH